MLPRFLALPLFPLSLASGGSSTPLSVSSVFARFAGLSMLADNNMRCARRRMRDRTALNVFDRINPIVKDDLHTGEEIFRLPPLKVVTWLPPLYQELVRCGHLLTRAL